MMEKLFVALRACVYGGSFVLLWGWLAIQVRVYDRNFEVELPQWTILTGVFVAGFGAILSLLCVIMFIVSGRGTPAPFDAPRRFVATGPYRYVRNPMYLGGYLLLLGAGLFLGSVSIALLSFGFLVFFHLFVMSVEEPGLEQRFGQSYLEYKQRVNRWIPRLEPSKKAVSRT
ncbi:MAG: isoprenylcysteine carboxylmethyltransferase family protein [Ignavibacteria bacterium]|nr:isoprenylcysteine carboxylmethyltransferase family protein [Ignavibacteria bacterium]